MGNGRGYQLCPIQKLTENSGTRSLSLSHSDNYMHSSAAVRRRNSSGRKSERGRGWLRETTIPGVFFDLRQVVGRLIEKDNFRPRKLLLAPGFDRHRKDRGFQLLRKLWVVPP